MQPQTKIFRCRCLVQLGISVIVAVAAYVTILWIYNTQVQFVPLSIGSLTGNFHKALRTFQQKRMDNIRLENNAENTEDSRISAYKSFGSKFDSKFDESTSKFCVEKKPDVLIWIYSAPKNLLMRNVIRNTWGKATEYEPARVVIVFSLGAVRSKQQQLQINQEKIKHGDVIQDVGFYDAYENLTFKAQSMLRWSSQYCSGIKLLFKVDDDSHLLPGRISLWLQNISFNNQWPKQSVIGTVWKNSKPNRKGRWKLGLSQWPYSMIAPLSCPGAGYFITGDALSRMNQAMKKVPFLWLEDMYVTGVLATSVGLKYIDNSAHHLLYYSNFHTASFQVTNNKNIFLIGQMPDANSHTNLWNYIEKIK